MTHMRIGHLNTRKIEHKEEHKEEGTINTERFRCTAHLSIGLEKLIVITLISGSW